MKRHNRFIGLVIGILLPVSILAQDDVGLPFLKIGIGARQSGLAGVFTGVADDVYSIYTNPGGLGHLRRWQWSADYNVWFADVHQATLSMVRQFRLLGSRKTSLGLSLNYLGMPEWDATGGMDDPVSVHHMVAGVSIGQRLDWITRALAIGVNLRGFTSTLGDYEAQGWFTDVGLLLRPGRFSLRPGRGLFDYGIISLGASLLNIGKGVTFHTKPTALPETWRAGLSLLMGRYQGWSLLLASDAIGVKGRDWVIALGGEIWWKNILGARAGYRWNRYDLGDFSFGFGMRWDDVLNTLFQLPSRFGDAFEFNVADVGYGTALKQTYRGSFSHYPVAPEPFRLDEPRVVSSQVLGQSSSVTLSWEKAFDPDPFDRVNYLVMVSKVKGEVDRAVARVEKDFDGFMNSALRDSLLLCESVPETVYDTHIREGGIYYWAVAAYDLAHHARLAKRGEETVKEFVVSTPDLMVKALVFQPYFTITTTPEQGTLILTVANTGSAPSGPFNILWNDLLPGLCAGDTLRLMDEEIPNLMPGTDTSFVMEWNTACMGSHEMEVILDSEDRVFELNRDNNRFAKNVVSIPKGVLASQDSAEIIATGYDYIEMPIVPEVYFAPHSSRVDERYYQSRDIYPAVLSAFAERLRDNPSIVLRIMGSIDILSGENDPVLSLERAQRVRDVLLSLGVSSSQLDIVEDHPRMIEGQRPMPSDSLDARWIMEQNRAVSFDVDQIYEETVFKPFRMAADTTLRNGGIPFDVDIFSPGGLDEWRVRGETVHFEIIDMSVVHGDSLRGHLMWDGMDRNGLLVLRNHYYTYRLLLTDSLGREFGTPMDSIYVRERRTLQRWEMFGAAKFAQVEPVYQFYWDHLMDIARELVDNPNMSVRFEGHACAIGNEAANQVLSLRRAQRFTEAFKERIRRAYPDKYLEVWKRIEEPKGFGENVPLRLRIEGLGDILLGDNNTPIGRYLNRRIMVLLYKEN